MKKLIVLVALAGFCLPALAATQQEKMKSCNADAKTKALKGDEHKKFMKECLSAKPAAAAATSAAATPAAAPPAAEEKKATQQEKMKSCNAQAKAKSLKGDEHKKFMSTCLKG